MNRSEQIGDLMTALAKAQSELTYAAKGSDNPAFHSKYADLASVIDAVRPVLSKHGIAFVQMDESNIERQTASVTTSLHYGEQWISVTAEAPAVGRGGFNVQSLGAAWTYLRRYPLQAVTGLASDDDDGNSISDQPTKSKEQIQAEAQANAMEYLNKLGVTDWQILNSVGVPSPKELETEHLVTLRVLCAKVKRGDKTIEEVFGSAYDKEIESLFTQLKMNDAQQRMLRQSYMGRAKSLAEYLRDRLGTPRPAPEVQPITQESVSPSEPEQSVEDRVAQASTIQWNEQQEPAVAFDPAVTGTAKGAAVTFDQPPPKRKAKVDQTRRATVSTEAIVEARSETAEQAREEVENLIEQSDPFAF